MVKFKFYIDTPYGGHFNTHYAKSKARAKEMIDRWNTELKETGYSVRLVDIIRTSESKAPEGYTIW